MHKLRWAFDNILVDNDGSLGGKSGSVVLFNNSINYNDPTCDRNSVDFFLNGIICSSSVDAWSRFNILSVQSRPVQMSVTHDNFTFNSFRLNKQLHFGNSHFFAVGANKTFEISFKNLEKPVSFYYRIYAQIDPASHAIVTQKLGAKPDKIYINGYRAPKDTPLNSTDNVYQWYFDNTTNTISFMLKPSKSRWYVNAYIRYTKCQYVNCIAPTTTTTTTLPPPTTKPPPTTRPPPTTTTPPLVYVECPERLYTRPDNGSVFWSEPDTWNLTGKVPDTYDDGKLLDKNINTQDIGIVDFSKFNDF